MQNYSGLGVVVLSTWIVNLNTTKSPVFGNRSPCPFLRAPFFFFPLLAVHRLIQNVSQQTKLPPFLQDFVGNCLGTYALYLHNVRQSAFQLANQRKVQILDFLIWLVRSYRGLSRSARGPSFSPAFFTRLSLWDLSLPSSLNRLSGTSDPGYHEVTQRKILQ